MLTVRLDPETEQQLAEILAHFSSLYGINIGWIG